MTKRQHLLGYYLFTLFILHLDTPQKAGKTTNSNLFFLGFLSSISGEFIPLNPTNL